MNKNELQDNLLKLGYAQLDRWASDKGEHKYTKEVKNADSVIVIVVQLNKKDNRIADVWLNPKDYITCQKDIYDLQNTFKIAKSDLKGLYEFD